MSPILANEGYAQKDADPEVIIDYSDVNVVATIVFSEMIRSFKIRNCKVSNGDNLVQHGKQGAAG
jgi:hypothetical protein